MVHGQQTLWPVRCRAIRPSHSERSHNYEQSSYRLDYAQDGVQDGVWSHPWWSGIGGWLVLAVILPLGWFASRLGRRLRVTDQSSTAAALELK